MVASTESTIPSLVSLWSNLQKVLISAAPSGPTFDVPKLKQLNDMVYEVSNPKDPDLEVVFFHGLRLGPCHEAHVTTWMSRDNSQMWLSTWLVEEFPNAHILSISYDSSARRTHDCGTLDIFRTAENLLSDLTDDRARVGEAGCPVVLVGHCLGGLLLEELCLYAGQMIAQLSGETPRLERINDLFSNLGGMFFYGTPQMGSLLGDKLRNSFKGALLGEMETFQASSARRNQQFQNLRSKYRWLTSGVGESFETFVEYLGKHIQVGSEASTRPYMDSYYTAAANHLNICKPKDKNDSTFTRLTNSLNEIKRRRELQTRVSVSREYVDEERRRASHVLSMLAKEDGHTVFIVGMSGIGKTALARKVFEDISPNFRLKCFVNLDGVEGSSCEEKIMRKIYDGLEGVDKGCIGHYSSILQYLKGRKVLMVLDNVESEDELKALRTDFWLDGKSRLLVTTSTDSLCSRTPSNTFQVPYLSRRESQQLFFLHSFQNGDGPQMFPDFVEQLIDKCENYPLSLKILGRYIMNTTEGKKHEKGFWLDLIDRMDKAQPVGGGHDSKLWARLQPYCYDLLPSTAEQELFLDVATMFHGFSFSLVQCIWAACRESPVLAWDNLQRRYITEVDKDGRIWMHSQIRDLGKRIACPPGYANRWRGFEKWRRISETILTKEFISNYVEFTSDRKGDGKKMDALDLKLQNAENKLVLAESILFNNCNHLHCLILEGVQITAKTVELPKSLVYLRWANGLFRICPVNFTKLKKLVLLDLSDCRAMESLPPDVKNATKLRWLELKNCGSLTRLPSGIFKYLKYLGVEGTCVTEVPSNYGKSKQLQYLHANRSRLSRLPKFVGGLRMLVSLEISNTPVERLADDFGKLSFLHDLNLGHTSLRTLPNSFVDLRELETLILDSTPLEELPDNFGFLKSLRRLNLNSSKLETFPHSIGASASLYHLELCDTRVRAMPGTFHRLVGLKYYAGTIHDLGDELLVAFSSLKSLKSLRLEIAGQGEDVPLDQTDGVPHFMRSQWYYGNGCDDVSYIPAFRALTHLELTGKRYLQSLLPSMFRALSHIASLHDLSLVEFNLVEEMPPELGTLTGLKHLCILRCRRLQKLPESLYELSMLTELVLWCLPKLSGLPDPFGAMAALSSEACHTVNRKPTSPIQPRCMKIDTDSWRLLKSFLEYRTEPAASLPEVFYKVHYRVECLEMESVMKMVTKRERGGRRDLVLDTKVAMELLIPRSSWVMDLDCQGQDNSLHDQACGQGFTSHSPWHYCAILRSVYMICSVECAMCTPIRCNVECETRRPAEVCSVHTNTVRVKDTGEESDTDIEDTDDLDIQEGGTDSELDQQDRDGGIGEDRNRIKTLFQEGHALTNQRDFFLSQSLRGQNCGCDPKGAFVKSGKSWTSHGLQNDYFEFHDFTLLTMEAVSVKSGLYRFPRSKSKLQQSLCALMERF